MPVPVPFDVIPLYDDIVGVPVVFHTTPLAVTDDVPDDVTLPPLSAVVPVILVGTVVVTVGNTTGHEYCNL